MYADQSNHELKTLVLSTNITDYNTGEPIPQGRVITNTIRKDKKFF